MGPSIFALVVIEESALEVAMVAKILKAVALGSNRKDLLASVARLAFVAAYRAAKRLAAAEGLRMATHLGEQPQDFLARLFHIRPSVPPFGRVCCGAFPLNFT